MSATSTPNDSPASAPIQPMHNPSQAAHIVVPQAPLGNTTNGSVVPPGMGMKALLAKKMTRSNNPKFVSPTDNMVTPVTQKLNAARQKRFAKAAKPTGNLFLSKERGSQSSDEEQSESDVESSSARSQTIAREDKREDANPFE